MKLAPIILFVYNRADHALRTLQALSKNDLAQESELFIYADGPKSNATEEQRAKIAEVRRVIRQEPWCGKVRIIESEKNKGLADSIIGGVTETVNKYGRVIVLEDDICTSPGFLRYMNEALEVYKDDAEVMQVSGYIYPHTYKTEDTTCFMRVYSCWGWATWKRAWDHYEHDIDVHLSHYNTSKLKKKFDIEGHGKFYWQLVANKNKEIYTWAVRWYASWLFAGGYNLFPMQSLLRNIGFDASGEHCNAGDALRYNSNVADRISIERIPIQENVQMRKIIDEFYKKAYNTSWKTPIVKALKGLGIFNMIKKVIPPCMYRADCQNVNWGGGD